MHEDLSERAHRVLSQHARSLLAFRPRSDFRRASDARLHALRIAAKKLRYAMEIFDQVWTGGLRQPIVFARALQDAGGEYHDWSVLCQRLKREIRRLGNGETAHLAFEMGRLLASAEDRRRELRAQMLPGITQLRAALQALLTEAQTDKPRPFKPGVPLREARDEAIPSETCRRAK